MITFSENLKKTEEMQKYEKETGKFAIWQDKITIGFKKWQRGEKIYDKDKERIMVLVTEEMKERWVNFIKKNEYPTISKFIREAINFFIDFKENLGSHKSLTEISKDFKDSLTIIKGYSQLLHEKHENSENSIPMKEILFMIKIIYEESLKLEAKIAKNLDGFSIKETYDILIIEDDLSTINLLVHFFKMKGYKCKYVLSGTKALEELQSFVPKFIFIDIILPDINGYSICKNIKSNEKLKNVPAYFITAIPYSEFADKLEETEADGYFIKPFDFKEFEILFKNS